jgi:hypothetical protein
MLTETGGDPALRAPQGGSPPSGDDSTRGGMDLVGDIQLVAFGMKDARAKAVAHLLLRVQTRTWAVHHHILSLSDDFVSRKIKEMCRTGKILPIYCRCLRCGCLATLSHWIQAVDWESSPLIPGRRFVGSDDRVIDSDFGHPCKGNDWITEALDLLS